MKEKYTKSLFLLLIIFVSWVEASTGKTCDLLVFPTKAISSVPVIDKSSAEQNSSRNIDVVLSPNEFEPLSLVLVNNGSETCNELFVATTLIPSDVPGLSVDVRVVKRWYQGGGAWKSIGRKGPSRLIPELIVHDDTLIKIEHANKKNYLKVGGPDSKKYINISKQNNKRGRVIHSATEYNIYDSDRLIPFDIEKGDIRQLWLNVHALKSVRPGLYKARVLISQSNKKIKDLVFNIRVLDVDLKSPNILYSIFYRGKLVSGEGTVSSEYKDDEQYLNELINLKDHGIQSPVIYQGFSDKYLFNRAMNIQREVFDSDRPVFLASISASTAITMQKKNNMKKGISYLERNKAAFGASEYFYFGKDEAVGNDLVQQKSSWQYARNNGVRIFTTGYEGTYSKVGTYLDLLILAGRPKPTEIVKIHKANGLVYTYAFPQSGPENPLLFRKNYGLALWQVKVDGAMPYVYHDSSQSVWNDFDHEKYRDHNFTYPTINGVVDTLAWEGFREAVDDVRYVNTLNQLIFELDSSASCISLSCRKRIAQGRSLLKSIKLSDLKNLQNIRSEMQDILVWLSGFKNDQN